MAGIRLEWAQFGDFDNFDVLRADEPMDVGVLPSPIATGLSTMYYVDTTVVKGETYYYRVVAWRDAVSKLSGEIATQAGDLFWSDVELLIFADAPVFPSTTIIDSSSKQLVITRHGTTRIIAGQSPLDDGWIALDGGSNYISSNLSSALNTDDFTLEAYVQPNYSGATTYGRLFAIGTHTTNGMISVSKSGTPWTLNIDVFNGGWWGGAKVANPPGLSDGVTYHVCLMRKSGKFYLFINGGLAATLDNMTSLSLSQQNMFIATHPYNGGSGFESFAGKMSSIRLTRHARYSTGGLTQPCVKFPTGG